MWGIILEWIQNNWVAIPAGSDCGYWLFDFGYRGIPGDGMEAVYAPIDVVNAVCN